jgi:hypothetical protein
MLPSALTILLLAVTGAVPAAAAPQLAPNATAAAPSGSTSRTLAFELGLQIAGAAFNGALIATEQMLVLEQAMAAGGSAEDGSSASGTASTSVAGSAPNSAPGSAPSGVTTVTTDGKILPHPQRLDQQQVSLDQQIKAARVSSPNIPVIGIKYQRQTGHHRSLHDGSIARPHT